MNDLLTRLSLGGISLLFDMRQRATDRFSPLFYSRTRRVVDVIDGALRFSPDMTAVLVVYQLGRGIPFYIRNVLDQFERLGVSCWVTVNADASSEVIEYLVAHSYKVVVRRNFGRDFGGYKDVISFLDLGVVKRLIILNDSMFYYSKGLESLFDKLVKSEQDVVCLTSSFDGGWHVQSYLVSLSKAVFLTAEFSSFWNRYKPYNSRRHAIRKGELEFSRVVLAKHYDRALTLYNHLGVSKYVLGSPAAFTSNVMPWLVPDDLSNRPERTKSEIKAFSKKMNVMMAAERHNPSHALACLAAYALGFFVLKRDVVFRRSFGITKIIMALNLLGIDEHEVSQTVTELEFKGCVERLRYFDRLKSRLGLM